MIIVLLRHGRKQGSELPDEDRPLDAAEYGRADRVRERLAAADLAPRYILTSRYRHAVETAERVRCKRTRAIIPVTGLTPHTDEAMFSLPAMLHESGVVWRPDERILLVGHELRLSNLAQALTGEYREPQLDPLGA